MKTSWIVEMPSEEDEFEMSLNHRLTFKDHVTLIAIFLVALGGFVIFLLGLVQFIHMLAG